MARRSPLDRGGRHRRRCGGRHRLWPRPGQRVPASDGSLVHDSDYFTGEDVYARARDGKPEHFRSVIYKNTGHEYLPEMKEELIRWLDRHLPLTK